MQVYERGVTINGIHTGMDLGAILSGYDLTNPEIKTDTVDIPGTHGITDNSEILSKEPLFKNRTLTLTFSLMDGDYQYRQSIINKFLSYFHGMVVKVIHPDDSMYYITGRCNVKTVTNTIAYGTVTMEIDAYPFRLCTTETVETIALSGYPKIYDFKNTCSKAIQPVINVTGNVMVESESFKKIYKDQSNIQDEDFFIHRNETLILKLSGTGSISFVYRKGVL